MRKFLLLLLVLWLTSERSHAAEAWKQDGPVMLVSAERAEPWTAVGRVNVRGVGFCTGTLVSDSLVLTAAHCMYDRRTGRRVPLKDVEFLAGWRNGRAVAVRRAQRVAINPAYRYSSTRKLQRVATDLALIQLDRPIPRSQARPFGFARSPVIGQEVKIVSYVKDHEQAPSLQESCRVLGRDPKVLVLSCGVNFGASGSPVFAVENGRPRIASIISAKAEWRSRDVALGTALGETLTRLAAQLGGPGRQLQLVLAQGN